jgi:CBS domain-containing protein
MPLAARHVMKTDLKTVEPDLLLTELERRFLADRVSGFPVVERGRLVGIVSRSDIVRQLCVEQSLAESASDYYQGAAETAPVEQLSQIADRVGTRIETLRVRDVMIRTLITVGPDQPLRDVARTMAERGIHRVPVTEGDRLVGLISTIDIVRLVAAGRLTEAAP